MKLIKKLYNLKWYKALPIWFLILGLIVFGFYKILTIGTEGTPFNDNLALLKLSIIIAIPFSLFVVFSADQMKKSEAFWDRAREVEKEIDSVTTLEELNRIINDEFSYETGVLRKMASVPPHYQKMREMHKVIETISKYVS